MIECVGMSKPKMYVNKVLGDGYITAEINFKKPLPYSYT